MLFVKYIPTFFKVRENHDDGNSRFLWTFGVYQPAMASCPGLQFDWSATVELCTLVVPHILSATCTTVTRLHGVTSQNNAVLNQQTMWQSALQPDTFHSFAVLFPVLPTYRHLTVKLVYFKELPHIFQDRVSNCFVLLLHHKCSIKTHLDTCQYLHAAWWTLPVCLLQPGYMQYFMQTAQANIEWLLFMWASVGNREIKQNL